VLFLKEDCNMRFFFSKASHSMVRANLNKSKNFMKYTTKTSKYVNTRVVRVLIETKAAENRRKKPT
jgi:hypothetical protein